MVEALKEASEEYETEYKVEYERLRREKDQSLAAAATEKSSLVHSIPSDESCSSRIYLRHPGDDESEDGGAEFRDAEDEEESRERDAFQSYVQRHHANTEKKISKAAANAAGLKGASSSGLDI